MAGLGGECCRAGRRVTERRWSVIGKNVALRVQVCSLDKQPHLILLASSPAPTHRASQITFLPRGPGSLLSPTPAPLLGWPPKVRSHWKQRPPRGSRKEGEGPSHPSFCCPSHLLHTSPGSGLLTAELLIPLTLHSLPTSLQGAPLLCALPLSLSKNAFIYLFMIVLALGCRAGFPLGATLVVNHRFLILVASLCLRAQTRASQGLRSCGSRAPGLRPSS